MHPAATLSIGNLEHVVGRQSSVQHRCRTSGVKPVKCLAKRLPKNPSDFKNYDDLREHLHSEHAGFSMSDVLNWLSNNAFGASRSTANGSFAAAYQWLVKKREPQMSRLQAKLEEVPKVQQEEHVAKVAEVLLCEPWLVHRMARKMPELLSMECMALARRLLLLKRLLPECDVAQLVELQPCWLLQQPDDVVTTQLQRSRQQLLQSLLGSLFSRMCETDPTILLETDSNLGSGLQGLRDLWDVDASALADSDPADMILAVRAMSSSGPPSKV